jgi:nanoRNase/pAp phosphatase (c-di-AMP/oligoRNAs hydrolase)
MNSEGLDVAQWAERFGGKGHSDVAGCFIPNNQQAVKNFLRSAQSLLD